MSKRHISKRKHKRRGRKMALRLRHTDAPRDKMRATRRYWGKGIGR